jgi:hypothetical protein
MEIYWGLGLATVAVLVILSLAIYLALTRDDIEVEFKGFPPTIRVVARRK